MNYLAAMEKVEYGRIDKLNRLNNVATFWADVRKLSKNCVSDHAVRSWQRLAEIRYSELKLDTVCKYKGLRESIKAEFGETVLNQIDSWITCNKPLPNEKLNSHQKDMAYELKILYDKLKLVGGI